MAKQRKRRNWRTFSRPARLDQDEIDAKLEEREPLRTRVTRWRERLEELEEAQQPSYDPEEFRHYPLGTVINMRSGHHFVQLEGEGRVVDAKLKGSLKRGIRFTTTVVAPGDRVHVELLEDGSALIVAIVPRRNALSRPDPMRPHLEDIIIANVDQLVIVSSVGGPAFWPELIDRFLVFAEYYELNPLIVVNKTDQAAAGELEGIRALYADQLGYRLLFTSVESGEGLSQLKEAMRGLSNVIVGLSGVGKSSLLNAIQPGLNLRVRSVNVRYGGEGKHTTRSTTLHALDIGGFVADTPGIREFGVWDITPEEVDYYFVDFRPYLGKCKFSDCTHHQEPQCAVRAAVERGEIAASRYRSFLVLFDETDPAHERPF